MADDVKDLKEVKEPKKEVKKDKENRVSMKTRFSKFFKEVRAELKKVIWPTITQLRNNTATVLLFCLIIGALIWLFDLGLVTGMKQIFGK